MFALFSLKTDRKSCIAMGDHPELGLDMATMVTEIFNEQSDPKTPDPVLFGACDHRISIERKPIGAYHGIFENNTDVEVLVPPTSLLIMVDFKNIAEFSDYTGDELGGYSEICGIDGPSESENSGLTALTAIYVNDAKDMDHQVKFMRRRKMIELPNPNDPIFHEPSPSP